MNDTNIRSAIQSAHVLIVDDEPANVRLLERVLQRDGFTNLVSLTDSRLVAEHCASTPPDLVLLDLMMPHCDGFAIIELLKSQIYGAYLPILMLTADVSPRTRERALSSGAQDFLTKPFNTTEVLLRVRNLLAMRALQLELRDQNRLLEARVQERTRALEESQLEVLERLAQAAEFRDDDTGQHTQRVGMMTAQLARELRLDEKTVSAIRYAAPLHDVGKIGISDLILLKPGRLTPQEFETMKTHAAIGASMLQNGHSEWIQTAERIAHAHHEKWDGSGYPCGLKGDEIPIEGRLLAVVDVFDALTNERPYKKAWALDEAIEEIQRGSGTHFDPEVVTAFLVMMRNASPLSPPAADFEIVAPL